MIVLPLQLLGAEKELAVSEIKAFGNCSWDWSFAETLLHIGRTFPKTRTFIVKHLNNEVDGRSLDSETSVKTYLKERIESSVFVKPKELPGAKLERATYVDTVGFTAMVGPIKLCSVPCKVTYTFQNVPGLLLVAPQNAIEISFRVKDMSTTLQDIMFNRVGKSSKSGKSTTAQLPLILTKVKIESMPGVVESQLVSQNLNELTKTLKEKYGLHKAQTSNEMTVRGEKDTSLTFKVYGKGYAKSFSITYQSEYLWKQAHERFEKLRIKDELESNKHKFDTYLKLQDHRSKL